MAGAGPRPWGYSMETLHPEAKAPRLRLTSARDVIHVQRELLWNAKGAAARGDLTTSDLVVFNKLVMHADREGRTTVRVARIVRDTKLSERTVRGSLAKLRRVGFLESVITVTSFGRANTYRVLRPANDVHVPSEDRGPAFETGEGTRFLPESIAVPETTTAVAIEAIDAADASMERQSEPAIEQLAEHAPVLSSHASEAPHGFCMECRTGPAPDAGSAATHPSSDRGKVNDPPVGPPGGPRDSSSMGDPEETSIVTRVLTFFIATLWPKNVGPSDTPQRRRVVGRRLRELLDGEHPNDAERVLCDAVIGASIDSWHREADHRNEARIIFRDLDRVERLARQGRAKRVADERQARRREEAIVAANAPPVPAYAPPSRGGFPEGLELPNWLKPAIAKTTAPAPVLPAASAFTDEELAAFRAADAAARERIGLPPRAA